MTDTVVFESEFTQDRCRLRIDPATLARSRNAARQIDQFQAAMQSGRHRRRAEANDRFQWCVVVGGINFRELARDRRVFATSRFGCVPGAGWIQIDIRAKG